MATLLDMRLGKDKQISYRSTPDIVAKLDFAAARLASKETTFGGDKLRTGHLVNAIALWLGKMSDDELMRFALPKLKELEAHLGRREDEGEGDPEGEKARTPDVKVLVTHVPIYGRGGSPGPQGEGDVEVEGRRSKGRKK